MSDLSLKDLHALQLEIAKEIKRICEICNIEYFLIGGTLLGAIRHGGFIPWDDDMDIGMTCDYYDKFISIAPEYLDNRFSLHTFENDEKCGYVFAKLRLKETHMREAVLEGTGIDNGIFVDIFPYDLAGKKDSHRKSRHMTKLRLLGKLLMIKSGYRLNDITHNFLGKMLNTFLKVVPMSRNKCWMIISKEIKKSQIGEIQDYYIERDGMFKGNFVFPKTIIEEKDVAFFEGVEFTIPKNYDNYLKNAYGDYMRLPPEEERKIGHSVIDVTLDKPFDSYFIEIK